MRDIFISGKKEKNEFPPHDMAAHVLSMEKSSIAGRIFRLLGHAIDHIIFFIKRKGRTARGKAALVLSAACILAASIFVFAELGGSGVNGPATAPNSLDYGLVGYWDMEEGSGQTVYDKSGNGNDCTLGANASEGSDDPVFAAGHDASGANGVGMKFDGINDYLNCGADSSLDTTQAITVSVWFYTNAVPASYFGLVGEQYTDSDGSYQLYLGGSNQIIWATALEPDTRIRTVGYDSFLGAWHNVTSTFSLDEQLQKIYVDGIKIVEESRTVPLELSTKSLKIGGQSLSMGTIDGSIDEVRIYNRALSQDEILLLYNQKKPILQYKFDEGTGTTLYDESYNDNDATLVNTPSYVTGKSATALDLESTSSQYGYLADNASISLTKDLTLSAWINPESTTASTQFDIAGKWDGTNESYLLSQYGDEIRVYIDSSSSYKTTNSANLAAGNWYHVEAVYTASTQSVDIYVNGMLQTGTVTGTIPASIGDDAGRFQIGAEDSTTTATNFYDGIIDGFRLYNYARTQDEVLTDYNDGLAAKFGSGTRGWYGGEGENAWGYRKLITISHLQVSNTDQSNFPVLVSFTDANLKTVASGGRVRSDDGYDIIFTASDGMTLLDFEIEKYVPSTGEVAAWVKIPVLSASADIPMYMYYGADISSSLEDVSGVWDDGGSGHFASVWHLGESPAATAGDFDDATANDNDSVNTTNQPDAASGKIDGALDFNGADDYLEFSDSQELRMNTGGTISAWINLTSIGEGSAGRIIDKSTGTSAENGYMLAVVSSQVVDFEVNGGSDTLSSLNAITLGQSQLVTVTFDGSGRKIYVNGTDVTSSNGSLTALPPDTSGSLSVGNRAGNTDRALDGIVDEVRLSNVVRSADWIKTEFNNQNAPATFYAVGDEQAKPALILDLKLDEGSGAVAYDETINDHDGTLGGGTADYMPAWVAGKHAGALSFDGTNDYVDISNALPIHSLTSYSISLWIKGASGQSDKRLFSQGSSTNSLPLLTIGTDFYGVNGKLDVYLRDENNVVLLNHFQSQSTVFDDTWHHIEFTDTAGNVQMFVDGVLDNSSSYAPLASALPCDRAALGAVSRSSLSNFYAGLMDDVRIYNYARTAEEVSVDYNNGQAAHLGKNNQDLSNGLAGYWDMEEGGGQTVYDKSGNGNSGILGDTTAVESNDPVFGPGHDSARETGSGIVYDGYDDYANAGTGSSLNVTGAITMSAWVKPSVSDGSIIRKVDANLGYMMHLMSDQRVQIGINEFNSPLTTGNNVITLDAWNHIVATVDGSGAAVIYVNGSSVATGSLQVLNTAATNPFLIGGDSWNSGNYFKGTIDEVRIYDRVLSADEIRYLYNQKKPILEYRFDEGSGATVYDESFNDNDGSLGAGTADYMPSWVQGKSGTALSFDGNDLISTSDSSSLDVSGHLTVEAWVYPTQLDAETSILSKGGTASCANYDFYIYNSKLALLSSASCNWSYSGSNSVVTTGVWQHIAATYDGTDVNYYINGVLKDSKAWGGIGAANTEALELGHQQAAEEGDFNGKIDDVRVYNYARSAAEVLQDYNSGLAAHLR